MQKSKDYLENSIAYYSKLYKKLVQKLKGLDQEDEKQKYVSLLLSSGIFECLLSMKCYNDISKQTLEEPCEISEDILAEINQMKPSFYLEGDELVNVSGMKFDELTDFMGEAISAQNNGEGKDS